MKKIILLIIALIAFTGCSTQPNFDTQYIYVKQPVYIHNKLILDEKLFEQRNIKVPNISNDFTEQDQINIKTYISDLYIYNKILTHNIQLIRYNINVFNGDSNETK